jgi:hypothetical protein
LLLDPPFLMAAMFLLTHTTYSMSFDVLYSSIHSLKSHPDSFDGGGKSSVRTSFKKI